MTIHNINGWWMYEVDTPQPKPKRTIRVGNHAFIKYKALKLVGPEYANSLGIPAEAPVFISPYIQRKQRCHECNTTYEPLMYQVGSTTHAHHSCKRNGGIYVRLATDTSGKWVYSDDLWDCLVVPYGPIRMGDDRGFQFESIKPYKFIIPMCHWCRSATRLGHLITNGMDRDASSLVALCPSCPFHETNHNKDTGWTFQYDGTEIHFSPSVYTTEETDAHPELQLQPLSYEAFLERTNPKRHKEEQP